MSVELGEEVIGILDIEWVLLELCLQTMKLLDVVQGHLLGLEVDLCRSCAEHPPQLMPCQVSS